MSPKASIEICFPCANLPQIISPIPESAIAGQNIGIFFFKLNLRRVARLLEIA